MYHLHAFGSKSGVALYVNEGAIFSPLLSKGNSPHYTYDFTIKVGPIFSANVADRVSFLEFFNDPLEADI